MLSPDSGDTGATGDMCAEGMLASARALLDDPEEDKNVVALPRAPMCALCAREAMNPALDLIAHSSSSEAAPARSMCGRLKLPAYTLCQVLGGLSIWSVWCVTLCVLPSSPSRWRNTTQLMTAGWRPTGACTPSPRISY